jgi:hypothetical protein
MKGWSAGLWRGIAPSRVLAGPSDAILTGRWLMRHCAILAVGGFRSHVARLAAYGLVGWM